MIDLRSDTVTRPTPAMLEAMFRAEVGDDVFGEDPAVNALEEKVACLFGKEAALYCASGTMTNQIAINVHTRPGDEVILHRFSHVYYYEGGGMMHNSSVSVCLLDGPRGMIRADEIRDHINPKEDIHRPLSTLVEVENTMNKGGGAVYPYHQLQEISVLCRKEKMNLHLDGARLFNALVESGEKPADYGRLFDSVSICLSKGLGAPVGSVLTGSREFISRARRVRKILGGAMRQAGYLAAAGIYALDHHLPYLKEDNRRAKELGKMLEEQPCVSSVMPVDSNIIIFALEKGRSASDFTRLLAENGILAFSFSRDSVRFVTHMGFGDEQLDETRRILARLVNK